MKLHTFTYYRTSPHRCHYRARRPSDYFTCPYCGSVKPSPNGTGSDVACCGEVGHAMRSTDAEKGIQE